MDLNSACNLLLSQQFSKIKNIKVLNEIMDSTSDQYINHTDDERFLLKSILISITLILIQKQKLK